MSSGALILLVSVWSIVIFITGYFFYRILTMPQHAEPDSFTENEEILSE